MLRVWGLGQLVLGLQVQAANSRVLWHLARECNQLSTEEMDVRRLISIAEARLHAVKRKAWVAMDASTFASMSWSNHSTVQQRRCRQRCGYKVVERTIGIKAFMTCCWLL